MPRADASIPAKPISHSAANRDAARPRTVRGRWRAVVAAALFGVCLSAAAEDMVLHRGTSAEPPSLDPLLGAGTLASPIINDMVAGLLMRGADSERMPGVAESWEVSDDGMTYTFRLREGLKWSDGAPFTADDFVYSYRRLADPATASRLVGLYFPIKNTRAVMTGKLPPEELGVYAPDERTVVFQLNSPTPYFPELIANVQAVPVPRHVIEKYGREWTRPGNMVTNGAFKLAERVPQSYIKLEKNPHFHDADSVRLDAVYFHPTQNLATSLKRFRSGELDLVLNFPPDEIEWIKENLPDALHVVPIAGTYFLLTNPREPPLDDVRVRRALYLSIDREAITDRLLRTGVTPAWTLVSPAISTYPGIEMEEAEMSFAERQELARELLREAGYDSSQRLELAYDTNEENRKIMVAISAMWQSIGVKTQLVNVDFPALFRKVGTGDFQLNRWFYIAPFDDAYSMLQLFLSRNPNNWPGLVDPKYDDLLRQSNLATDPAERQAILQQAERRLMSQYTLIPISFYVGRRLIAPRVKGWVDTPAGPTPSRYLWIED